MEQKRTIKKDYDLDTVTSIKSALEKLPDVPPSKSFSAREVVIETAEEIRQKLRLGYTHQQIAETLESAGLKITVGTLKSYLSIAGNKIKTKQRTRNAQKFNEETNAGMNVKTSGSAKHQATPVAPPRAAFQDPDEK